ncbi:MAG: hypothetical protein J5I52_02675, partial [Saprospiraceae bacterium]|nr:hypothetical protein [Saprospiraceae bacterium]
PFLLTETSNSISFFLFSHPPSERERKDNTFSILSKLLSLLFFIFFPHPYLTLPSSSFGAAKVMDF